MTRASDIIDPDELHAALEGGYVRSSAHPDDPLLRIYKYTEKVVVEDAWNDTLLKCRGLMIRHDDDMSLDGDVVARAFDKFFNHDEPRGRWIESVDPDARTAAYEKKDGSCGIIYRAPNGELAVATMGSFTSEQAAHATDVLHRLGYADWLEESTLWGRGWLGDALTPVVEIIYPENRIVVDNGDLDDLVALAAVGIADGAVYTPFPQDATLFWPGPVAPLLHEGPLSAILALDSAQTREGLVLHVETPDGWRMAKRKEPWYIEAHRIITNLNERVVWEKLGEVGLTEVYRWANEKFDTEHTKWIKETAVRLYAEMAERQAYVRTVSAVMKYGTNNRGEFARKVQQLPDKNDRAGVFMAYDNNLDRLKKWAHSSVRPNGNPKVGSPIGKAISE